MKIHVKQALIAAAGVLSAVSGVATAHHSYAMFDMRSNVTLTGTVRDFQWTNPHSWLWIEVPNSAGGSDQWGIEGMSPNFLARRGWSKRTLKPGDKVSVLIHPVKEGQHGGSFLSVTLPDGTVMRQSGEPPAALSAPPAKTP